MISICIGIYNWDCTKLIFDLSEAAEHLDVPCEIILIDDASEESYQVLNRKAAAAPHVVYQENATNQGRAAIRNQLAAAAQYPYLIFMDCDTSLPNPDFLQNYLHCLPADVIVGGTIYRQEPPEKDKLLRWHYGKQREEIPAEIRNQNPNSAFSTCNFLISKKILNDIHFDESLTGYGHEDTLLGLQLEEKGIIIQHINNPLIHNVSVNNDHYLRQLDNACKNLLLISSRIKNTRNFINSSRLLQAKEKLEKCHLTKAYRFFYRCFSPILLSNLKSAHPSMLFLDLYKLNSILCHAQNQKPMK